MAHDYEDFSSTDDLSDDELRQVVKERLAEHNMLDPDDIVVRVAEGVVTITGRVGTDGELRIAEHVLTDVLGLQDVRNELVVDAIRRAESPAAIDDHLVDEERHQGLLLGEKPTSFSDEAQHLEEPLDEMLDGTSDVQAAIEHGTSYILPTSPTPEGIGGDDAGRNAGGEDH